MHFFDRPFRYEPPTTEKDLEFQAHLVEPHLDYKPHIETSYPNRLPLDNKEELSISIQISSQHFTARHITEIATTNIPFQESDISSILTNSEAVDTHRNIHNHITSRAENIETYGDATLDKKSKNTQKTIQDSTNENHNTPFPGLLTSCTEQIISNSDTKPKYTEVLQHKDGKLSEQAHYNSEGQLEGPLEMYNESMLTFSMQYQAGKPHGVLM